MIKDDACFLGVGRFLPVVRFGIVGSSSMHEMTTGVSP